MSEVYTINDFITECNSYQYSKDRYEFLKESYELKLMNTWLESYNYMKEHEEIASQYDGMFTESVEHVTLIEEGAKEKAARLGRFIIGTVKKFIGKLISILARLASKLKAQNKDIAVWKDITIDDDLANDIITASKDIIKGSTFSKLTILAEGTSYAKFSGKIKLNDINMINLIMHVAYADDIKLKSSIGSDDGITINGKKTKLPIANENDIVNLYEELIKTMTKNNGFEKFNKGLDQILSKETVSFYMRDDYNLNRAVKALTEVEKGCENHIEHDETGDFLDDFDINLGTVQKIAATTVNVITTLIDVRLKLQEVLHGVLEKRGGKDNA